MSDGSVDEETDAFKLKLNIEIKKPKNEQRFPIYLAEVNSLNYYIVPLRGVGLWDAIWGYVALEGDKNTIKGAVFDHKAETAGLGAEITQSWFQNSFKGEKVLNKNGKLVGISVSKTNNDPDGVDKDDNEVDAISGATITASPQAKLNKKFPSGFFRVTFRVLLSTILTSVIPENSIFWAFVLSFARARSSENFTSAASIAVPS